MRDPRFTNSMGRWRTKSLFYELTLEDKSEVLFTLKEEDHEGFVSLYRLYMEMADLGEHRFAQKHLGGWSHWIEIANASWFKSYIDSWREELTAKIRTEAIVGLQEEARTGKARFQALKFLAEKGWETKPKVASARPGRPSDERIKQEAENLNRLRRDILEDHERIN